jgi:hypothetical protein
MTLGELRQHLAKISHEHDDLEVEVWLPGSTIRLSPMMTEPYNGHILIEGNVNPGSVLGS